MSNQRTKKRSDFNPEIASPNSADSGVVEWNDLSYLAGAVGSNDMGFDGGDMYPSVAIGPSEDWRTPYERQRRLRRHTIEQGSSTFSFPKDKTRGLTRYWRY